MIFCSGQVFFVYFLLVTLLNQLSSFEGFSGLGYGLILFIYGIVALEGNKIEFLIFSVVWVLIALISAYVMFGLLGIMTGEGIGELLMKSGDLKNLFRTGSRRIEVCIRPGCICNIRKKRRVAVRMEDWMMAGTFF